MIVDLLKRYHQERMLRYLSSLSEPDRKVLEAQLEAIDFAIFDETALSSAEKERIEPIDYLTRAEILRDKKTYESAGWDAILCGKVAAVLLAGGQGTRLGSSLPKGMFDIGVTHPLYLFEIHISRLLALMREGCAPIPFFVMTSQKNHRETVSFFEAHDYFGYPREYVRFFPQNMAPCVDLRGDLLLEDRTKLALSPDGNGGWYGALKKSGIMQDFKNIEWFHVFGVDNVLSRPADPLFVGATIKCGRECGVKGVKKAYPEEKVGLLVLKDKRPTVIEYYEMDEKEARLTDENGELVYRFGVTLSYLFSARRMEEIFSSRLPVHVVKKKVGYFDGEKFVLPDCENACKFETLILDMVRECETCLPFETLREEEFAPVKNATGVDSVETARELLKQNGVSL